MPKKGSVAPMLCVYCAVSLDGFIAGPNDELSWLGLFPTTPASHPQAIDFPEFLQRVGVIVMGRRTFDQMSGFHEWPYGDIPIWVLTRRPLSSRRSSVRAVTGDLVELCHKAQIFAGDADVYLDGGQVISEAIRRGCVDELILTQIPLLLGQGIPLYSHTECFRWHAEPLGHLGEAWQLRCKPASPPRSQDG